MPELVLRLHLLVRQPAGISSNTTTMILLRKLMIPIRGVGVPGVQSEEMRECYCRDNAEFPSESSCNCLSFRNHGGATNSKAPLRPTHL